MNQDCGGRETIKQNMTPTDLFNNLHVIEVS